MREIILKNKNKMKDSCFQEVRENKIITVDDVMNKSFMHIDIIKEIEK